MSAQKRHTPPEVIANVRKLLSQGATPAQIKSRTHLSDSTYKRIARKWREEREADNGDSE